MKIYKSLDDITVHLFYEIIDTNEVTLLVKKKKDRKNITIKKEQELHEIFRKILDEYCVETNNFKIIRDIKKKIYISKLEYKCFLLSKILAIFEKHEEVEVLFVLDELGYKFKDNKNINSEIKKLIRDFKLLQNKISIAKAKYQKQNKKEDKPIDLDYLSLNLERALDLKYSIDIKKTTMRRWINLNKLAKQKQ